MSLKSCYFIFREQKQGSFLVLLIRVEEKSRLAADEELMTETPPEISSEEDPRLVFLQPEIRRLNAHPTRPGRENEQKHKNE